MSGTLDAFAQPVDADDASPAADAVASLAPVPLQNTEGSAESIPSSDHHGGENVRVDGDGNDIDKAWDSTVEKYGAAVVYTNSSGERRLLTDYTVPTLSGMCIDETCEIKKLREDLNNNTWQDVFRNARDESNGNATRLDLVDDVLKLTKKLRASSDSDALYTRSLMAKVLDSTYVIPGKIRERETRVSVIRSVMKDKDARAATLMQERKEKQRDKKEQEEVEKSLVARRKRDRD